MFAGEQFDQGLKQYYLRARYMDPRVGRFKSRDTFLGMPAVPMSLHPYMYGNANAVGYLDPSGHMTLQGTMMAVGVVGVLTAASNYGIVCLGTGLASEDPDGIPDAAIFSLSGSAASGGPMGEVGGDVIYDFKTGKLWGYGFFGVGVSPVSIFKKWKGFGKTVAAGLVWNFSDPNDWSGFSVGATFPFGVLHLLPKASFSHSKMWGALTQLAKREKNVKRTDLSVQMGVSTAGPVALKLALRTNSFSTSVGWATDPIELTGPVAAVGAAAAQAIAGDFGTAEELLQ